VAVGVGSSESPAPLRGSPYHGRNYPYGGFLAGDVGVEP
jgi:hypothetical protein